MDLKDLTSRERVILILMLAAIGFSFFTSLGTAVYFLGWMPRSPEILTGRIYPAGAAFNTLVYVTKAGQDWYDFLDDASTFAGISVLLFVIFVLVPARRRRPR